MVYLILCHDKNLRTLSASSLFSSIILFSQILFERMEFLQTLICVVRVLLFYLLMNSLMSSANAMMESPTVYSCPTNGTNHLEIPVGTTVGSTTNVTIALSPSCYLCMLVRFTSMTGNRSSLNMQDWNMVPVARSYNNYPWENVAGPYADKLKISCRGISDCSLEIPNVADVHPPVRFALLTTNRQVSTKENVARFLEQVTFGPKLEDINKFNTSLSLNKQFATWVQEQMDPSVINPTLHREYFRSRVDNYVFRGRYAYENL